MLYKRIVESGTLNEPGGKPDPQFALPSTVNWMRALSMITADKRLDFATPTRFYVTQSKRNMGVLAENTVLEQLFLGLHHLSALEKMKDATPSADFGRIGILAWYYGHRKCRERDDSRAERVISGRSYHYREYVGS
jgi:hypothetical protein